MTAHTNPWRRWKEPVRVGHAPALLAFLAVALLLLAGCGPAGAPAAEETGSADVLVAGVKAVPAPSGPGRATEAPPPPDSTPAAGSHEHHAAPAAGPTGEHSIYHAGGAWRNRFGEELPLGDLGGRVQLVALVYTHCSYACPRIVATMKRIEGTLGEAYRDRVGFTLVSIDPQRDDPERLRSFGEGSRLDPERWTLLNGSDDDVLTLSVLLGVKYRATGDGEFAHSNVITVLDPAGVAVHRMEGLSAPVEPALEAIRRIAP